MRTRHWEISYGEATNIRRLSPMFEYRARRPEDLENCGMPIPNAKHLEKALAVVVAASQIGCVDVYTMVVDRLDPPNLDKDLYIVAIDDSASSASALQVFHSDYPGRTAEMPPEEMEILSASGMLELRKHRGMPTSPCGSVTELGMEPYVADPMGLAKRFLGLDHEWPRPAH